MRTTNLVAFLLPLLAIGLGSGEPAATNVLADELQAVAANTLTPEQQTALAAIDARLAGVEAIAAKIDDPDYKAEVARQIEDLQKTRLAVEKNFDAGRYEALMHSVISRYQVVALWLKAPPLPLQDRNALTPNRHSVDAATATKAAPQYSTCQTWQEVVAGENFRYAPVMRVSDPGTKDRPAYTGFWFYDGLQFDESGRYALAMKVDFQDRDVTPADRGEIGYIDLEDKNKWTKIGETAAWNWQQGCRLTWRGRSHEILWNDLADDGSHFVCRAYDFKTGAVRTLPRAIYDVSRDGDFALTHNFERMRHGKSTNYVGIPDRFEGQIAPAAIGIEKMDIDTGRVEFLISLERMAKIAFPDGYMGKTNLYFFREGWNPSGTRFIAFLKNADRPTYTGGWSISADGQDVRFLYMIPSHHAWLDDEAILEGRQLSIYKDDGSGKPQRVADVGSVDFDPTILPGGQWFVLDTYPLQGWQYVVLYHRPTRLFVPLAKLKNTAQVGTDYRVDIHARISRDGRTVCIDATHEGLGRQMYIIPIGYILDHPPREEGGNPVPHP